MKIKLRSRVFIFSFLPFFFIPSSFCYTFFYFFNFFSSCFLFSIFLFFFLYFPTEKQGHKMIDTFTRNNSWNAGMGSVWWELWPETEWDCRVKRIKTLIAINAEQIQNFKVKELEHRIGRLYLRKQTVPYSVEEAGKSQEVKCLGLKYYWDLCGQRKYPRVCSLKKMKVKAHTSRYSNYQERTQVVWQDCLQGSPYRDLLSR